MKHKVEEITYIIDYINGKFQEEMMSLYSYQYEGNKDVYAYYLNGHCPSYAQILYNIFHDTDSIRFFDTNSGRKHVFTEINGNFYDVRGMVNDCVPQDQVTPFEYDYMGYIQEFYGNNDTIDELLTQKLSEIGKKQKVKKAIH